MNVFGMVSTAASKRYTRYALDSFFATTPWHNDCFYLIDNDGSYADEDLTTYSRVNYLRNSKPLGFAANVNQIMRRAADERADLYFLNNDMIFTPHWFEPFSLPRPVILNPLSNMEAEYQEHNFFAKRFIDLDDYLGHEEVLPIIAEHHRARFRGYHQVITLPFFCVKIPFAVYSVVGPLDESFGQGGAEDDDYCLRTHLADFSVCFAFASYVLHFVGKSTWRGAESEEARRVRVSAYEEAFAAKWGQQLFEICLNKNTQVLEGNPEVIRNLQQGKIKEAIEKLLP